MGIADRMMENYPGAEVCIRRIYNRVKNNAVIKNNKLFKEAKANASSGSRKDGLHGSWTDYCNYIRNLGIKNGDILIVHSSMNGLEKFGVEKEEIVEFLRSLVGGDGTLVMPAYPFYKRKDIKLDFHEEAEDTLVYRPRTTLSWTGILPNYLCSLKETKRSLFPLDTLAAIGKEADDMVKDNLNGQISHGRNTAWDYCYQHHAKTLFLGVSPKHSVSEIHMYEDLNEDKWPVKGWYKEQKFFIKSDGDTIAFTCKSRKRFWNQFITESYCMKKLVQGGVMQYEVVENTPVGFIGDLYEMTGFVADCVNNDNDLLFWKIPGKYRKK